MKKCLQRGASPIDAVLKWGSRPLSVGDWPLRGGLEWRPNPDATPAGSRLSSDNILGALGAGEMGERYCARREARSHVAITILPQLFAIDPSRG